jgi:O-antigen/teichoic acid export membrane protein
MTTPSLRVNVVANYAGRIWAIASVYLFVPFYIRTLGMGAYGLIAFYSVALAILYIADAGLSSSFGREAAREKDHARLLQLLASIELALFGILTVAGLVLFLAATPIADRWLKASGSVSTEVAVGCVRLMPLALVPQIAMSLYFGGLMGLQRQVTANVLTTTFSVVRSGVVLLPISIWPDPRVFFAWQAVTSWVFVAVMRATLRRALSTPGSRAPGPSWEALRPILGYASGMFAMSILAGLNTQLDRIVVSKLRPLEEFALYSLAATLAQIPTIITMPVALALLPRLTNLVEHGQTTSIRHLYELNTYLIASVASAAAFSLMFFAGDVATLWMKGQQLPEALVPVVQILSAGGLFLALQLAPFQLSLAHGHNRTNVRLGVFVLLVTIPLQVLLTIRFGLLGAGVPWLLMNTLAFVYLGVALNRRFNPGHTADWFLRCSLPPVVICGIALLAARAVASAARLGPFASCVVAGASGLVGVGASYLLWTSMGHKQDKGATASPR